MGAPPMRAGSSEAPTTTTESKLKRMPGSLPAPDLAARPASDDPFRLRDHVGDDLRRRARALQHAGDLAAGIAADVQTAVAPRGIEEILHQDLLVRHRQRLQPRLRPDGVHVVVEGARGLAGEHAADDEVLRAAAVDLLPVRGVQVHLVREEEGRAAPDRLRAQRCIPEQANYREWRNRQLSAYTTLEVRENWWYLPDGRSLHVVCEQHPFGGVTYLYENATKEIQLESRYNSLIGVQRETLDNLEEGVALFGSDGRLKLFNPAFAQFWKFDMTFLDQEPHVNMLASRSSHSEAESRAWKEVRYRVTRLDTEAKQASGKLATGEDRKSTRLNSSH